jgi:hypothetical protein
MKIIYTGALVCALFAAAPVAAQTVPVQPAPAPAPIMGTPVSGPVLRTGTVVPLKMAESITTKGKKLKVGQRVHLEVAEDVKINGVTVIPIGSPAIAEITDVRNKGMWGKSGKINAQVLYVTVNGRNIRLSGQFDDKGVAGGVGAAAVSAIVFLPAGFFMTGTSAKIDMGSPVKAFVDEDVPLNIAGGADPAPLTVGAPAPAQVQAEPMAAPVPAGVAPAPVVAAPAK